MTPVAVREAVLRHLPILALVRGSPTDLDEFLGLPEGTTEQVQREQEPTRNGEGDECGRVD